MKSIFLYIKESRIGLVYSLLLSASILLVDYFDLPSRVIILGVLISVIVLAIITFIIIHAIKLGFLSSMRLPIRSGIDNYIIVAIAGDILLFIFVALLYGLNYRFWMCIGSLIILITIIFLRIHFINKGKRTKENKKYSVLDLKDFLENNELQINRDSMILVSDKDVNYDLLKRSSIVNSLFRAISECRTKDSFVISLEGPWGIGKTTILNLVKSKLDQKDITMVDDFDPWVYSDQESFFRAMFDTLMKKSGIKYSLSELKKIKNRFIEAIFSNVENGKIVTSIFSKDSDLSNIKKKINDYLVACNKRFVFIIDNIDRAEEENILLLFRLIGSIFDFKEIVFVLSFDENRIKKIYENNKNISYSYIEKIIQMQLKVPEFNRDELLNLVIASLRRLYSAYGAMQESIEQISNCSYDIIEIISNLRDLKRLINSINFNRHTDRLLNPLDSFIMELIRINNYTLYRSIFENRKYYISSDKDLDLYAFRISIDKKSFNDGGKKYFETLFHEENNYKYAPLLSRVFPYVKKYTSGYELENDGTNFYDKIEYKNIIRGKRISSGKYFNLYFTKDTNIYVEVNKFYEDLIPDINKIKDFSENDFIKNMFESFSPEKLRITVEALSYYLDEFIYQRKVDIAKSLIKNYTSKINLSPFIGLSTFDRVTILISDILIQLDEKEFESFLYSYKDDYRNLGLFRKVHYWAKNDNYCEAKIKEKKAQIIKDMLTKMSEEIFKNRISIYEDSLYEYGNLWVYYNLWTDNKYDIKSYISSILNEKNIIRFIYDICKVWVGTSITYVVQKSTIELYTTEDRVDELLNMKESFTEDEQYVLNIYNIYKNKEDKEDDDEGFEDKVRRHLNL